jgi:citrate lyase subunit beta / citryl-CoA lyase
VVKDQSHEGAALPDEGADAPRSLLFVPADRLATLLPKAVATAAEAIVVDLEDAVVPLEKDAARAQLSLLRAGRRDRPIYVRINAVASPWFELDLDAVQAAGVDAVVLPKVRGAEEITAVELHAARGGGAGPAVIALIETAAGVLEAARIAAQPSVLGLALGAEDLAADAGARGAGVDRLREFAAVRIRLAAAAAGAWAIDSPAMSIGDATVVETEARAAAELGFDGKLAIHPGQIGPIHRGFRPSPADHAEAVAILEAWDARDPMRGVATHRGKLIDAPILAAARRTHRLAARATEREETDVKP